MNEWKISYIYNGSKYIIILADTLELAIKKFREDNPKVPSLALYAIECVK